jgi:hypothetical protein
LVSSPASLHSKPTLEVPVFCSKKSKNSPVNSYSYFLQNPVIKKDPRGGYDFEGAPTLLPWSEIRAESRNNLFSSFYEGEFVVKTRHLFACQRLDEGSPMHRVKTALGHSDPRTTERYGEYSAEALEDIIEGEIINTKLMVQVNRQPIETNRNSWLGGKD